MKRLMILMISLLMLAFTGVAQDASLNKGVSYAKYNGIASDTVNADETWDYWLANRQDYSMLHDIRVKLDSVSGTPTCDVKLQAKVFKDDIWSDVATVSWTGTSSDTTFTFSEQSTAKFYRHYRIYLDTDETPQQLKVNEIEFKFWYKH
jgi:hypothetical protein